MPGFSTLQIKRWLWSAVLLVPVLFLCERYLDIPLALGVQTFLYGDSSWAKHTMHLPDLLLPLVLVTTLLSATLYWIRRRHGKEDTLNALLRILAITAPASYLAKTVLKLLFGRINTRVWLRDPTLYDFHWLHGGRDFEGFPSGHMMVMVALFAACWRYYPRYRPACLVLMLLLGIALIATNYHFLSDVIAGSYLALALEAALCALLKPAAGCSARCQAQGGGAGTS